MEVLGLSQVGMDENFFDLGGNSIQLAQVHTRLQALVGREFPITDLFVHTTIRATAAFFGKDSKVRTRSRARSRTGPDAKGRRWPLVECSGGESMTQAHDQDNLDGIAVIGMSGRFPGAKNVEQFWQNLVNGVETISRFREDELEFSVATPEAVAQGQTFIRARAILEDVDQFDAAFFGIYPREAELMDPQHRLFLECAWEALEAAGYDPDRYPGMIGVYAGLSLNTYLLYNLCADRRLPPILPATTRSAIYQVMLGNDKDFLPTRVSYKLNLRGPSMTIQSACSTSLVAVCQACTSLLNYQCDMALAGGVSISFPQKRDYLYQEEGMVSADGTCRVFDAEARGTVFGHGVAVVLLKRLADAVADGDPILAVIKGTAVNNDGSAKIGYAAPSVNAQAEVIALAQAAAGVDPGNGVLHRGPRHGNAAGRPHRGGGPDPGLPQRRGEAQRLLRHRHRQDPHRPPRRGGRRHRPDQDHPAAPTRNDSAAAALQDAESEDRLCQQPVFPGDPAAGVEAGETARGGPA